MIALLQFSIHLLEALHDYEVIQDSKGTIHNRRWHIYDSFLWLIVHGTIAFAAQNWWFLFTGLAIRFYVMQVVLNHLRKLPSMYLGDKGQDGWLKRHIGERVTFVLKTILFLTCFVFEPVIWLSTTS